MNNYVCRIGWMIYLIGVVDLQIVGRDELGVLVEDEWYYDNGIILFLLYSHSYGCLIGLYLTVDQCEMLSQFLIILNIDIEQIPVLKNETSPVVWIKTHSVVWIL